MDFSAGNEQLWHFVTQVGYISAGILLANVLRRKVAFVRKGLVPTAVIAGFLFLILKSTGLLVLDTKLLETFTYHGIALGFIALSLRIPSKFGSAGKTTAAKSGALIVSTYLLQAFIGICAVLVLAYTIMPDIFKASGILLPMGFGQGPGQANNIGSLYEQQYGFTGGQSFGLSLAASGYISACLVGVIFLNIAAKRKKIVKKQYDEISDNLGVENFQDNGEIPISESIDRFSIQVALVFFVYGLTYLVTLGITSLLEYFSPGVSESISPLLWGFNFIIGSMLAILVRVIFKSFGKARIMTRQYQNNYLLSRISGFTFDLMIVSGIAAIEIEKLTELWIPFTVMTVLGVFATLLYLWFICKKLYPNYYYEGLLSMYGMLTGTISSGVLLLREIDPELKTPAANNLITGSSFAIVMGAPMLIIVSLAPQSLMHLFICLAAIIAYFFILFSFIHFTKPKKQSK